MMMLCSETKVNSVTLFIMSISMFANDLVTENYLVDASFKTTIVEYVSDKPPGYC